MYSHSTGFLLFKGIACSCDRGSLRQHLKHCLIYCVAGLRSFVLSSKSIEPTQHARIELAAKAHGQLLLAPAQACARAADRCSSSDHWKASAAAVAIDGKTSSAIADHQSRRHHDITTATAAGLRLGQEAFVSDSSGALGRGATAPFSYEAFFSMCFFPM